MWQSGEGNQIYGNERLYSEGADSETIYLYGLHNSVYGYLTTKDGKETIRKQRYDDFGYAKGIGSGYGYNGEFRDESELIYLRARYYHPKIGRFIQIDSFKGDNDSIESQNRYIYTQNNPYKYTDPSGNELLEDFDFRDKYKPKGINQFIANTAKNLSNLYFDPKTQTLVSRTQTQRMIYAGNQFYQSGVTETCIRAGIEPVTLNLPVPCPQPDWTEDFLDGLQTILDWGGIIPGIGDVLDLLNAVIYYARGMMIDAVISVGCVIFSVVADTLLKPLRWAAKSVDDLAAKIVKKIPDFARSINRGIIKLSDKIVSQKWIPKWIREKVSSLAEAFTDLIDSILIKQLRKMQMMQLLKVLLKVQKKQ